MEFSYENEGTTTYLVYELSNEDDVDSLSFGMLTNNKIQGIAPLLYTQMNDKKFLKYNISSKVSMKQVFTGAINRKRLLLVLSNIVSAVIASQDYMIEINSLLLNMDYIFIDVATNEVYLICVPIIQSQNRETDLCYFFKEIMFQTQFDSSENCDYVAKIITFLNSASSISLIDLKQVLMNCLLDQGPTQNSTPTSNQSVKIDKNQNIHPTQKQSNQFQPMHNQSMSNQSIPNQAGTNNAASNQSVPIPNQPRQNKSIPKQSIPGQPLADQPAPSQPAPSHPVTNQPVQKKSVLNSLLHSQPKQKTSSSDSVPTPAANMSQASEKKDKKGFHLFGTPKKKTQPRGVAIPGQSIAIPGQAVEFPNAMQQTAATVEEGVPIQTEVRTPLRAQELERREPIPPVPMPQPVNNNYASAQMSVSNAGNFGETTVLNAGSVGETTVLNAVQQEVRPYLLRVKTNEKIQLNKPVFRIGKERSYVDYFISDNSAVSRSHASIIIRDEEYYLIDTNSTNHTYINGMMIASNVEMKLSHGMKVRFANEEFEFRSC